VQPDHLADLVADGVDGRERAHRLLEDHRDVTAADRPDRLAAGLQPRQVDRLLLARAARGAMPVEQHLAGGDAAGRVDDLQDRACRDALAAAALADHAERLAGPELEADVVDRAKGAVAGRELGDEPLDLQHRRPRLRRGDGLHQPRSWA